MKILRLPVLILAMAYIQFSFGQVSLLNLTAKPNDGIKFKTVEVWDLNITSGYSQSFEVVLSAEVYGSDSRLIARLSSNPVRINPGLNSFDQNSITAAQFAYINKDFGNFETSNGYLPDGDYSYCISIRCSNQQCMEIYLTETPLEECFDVLGIVPSPLLLSSPGDDEVIDELRPNFTWIPPMPVGGDPNINYEITLVQLQEEQSGENAIRRNRPLYKMEGLQQITLAFPLELEDLLPGERYAWQVNAYLGRTFIQSSEVWEFEIKEEEFNIPPMPYVKLKPGLTDRYNAVDELHFIFTEQNNFSSSLSFTIYDWNDNLVNKQQGTIDVTMGENSIVLDLKPYDLQDGKHYRIEIRDSKGNVFHLKFTYYYRR